MTVITESAWLRCLGTLCLLAAPSTSLATTIWSGPLVSFSKTANADPALEENQDRMTNAVWITRGTIRGIFNAATETEYLQLNSSPADTDTPSGEGQSGATDGEGLGGGSLTEATLRSLEEALAGIEEEFTVEDALAALDLVAELGRQRAGEGGSRASGSPDRPDY